MNWQKIANKHFFSVVYRCKVRALVEIEGDLCHPRLTIPYSRRWAPSAEHGSTGSTQMKPYFSVNHEK